MLALPSHLRRSRPNPRNYRPSTTERGGHLSQETINFIPASCKLRPLRDQMIVEPLDVVMSRLLIIPPHSTKLVRGIVRAIGPGHYPHRYDHAEKHKRTKVFAGTVFQPLECRVGQIVHLDGRQTGTGAFEQFWYGDKIHLHCREADVAGVES